jgi:tetratricopeptide (TPR) repeat protein
MAKDGAGETQHSDRVPGTTDAVEIAMDEQRFDLAPDSPARTLLIRQGRLVELQIRRERMLVWSQGLLMLVGVVAVLGAGVALWRASQDRSIIVRPFSVPEAYAARGLTGEAAALRLVTEMAAIREVTSRTSYLATTRIRDGGDNVSVQIPQTGLSVEELSRLLGRWLGKQTEVTGQIVDSGEGQVTLVLRSSRHGVSSVKGSAADIDALFVKLAEAGFAKAEPTNWVLYLRTTGRYEEAIASVKRLIERPETSDLALENAYSLWANSVFDPQQAIRLAGRSLALNPHVMTSRLNLVRAHQRLGHDETALAEARRLLALKDSQQDERYRSAIGIMRREARIAIQLLIGSYQANSVEAAVSSEEIRTAQCARPSQTVLTNTRAQDDSWRIVTTIRQSCVLINARAHDAGLARLLIQDGLDQRRFDPQDITRIQAEIALARDDGAAALVSVAAMESALERRSRTPIRAGGPLRQDIDAYRALDAAIRNSEGLPLKARALIAAGRPVEARDVLSPTPLDAYQAVIARGEAASALKDWAEADRWFARAKALAPSLPWAHLADGRSRLARGDLAGAEAALKVAQQRAPRLAEVRYEQGLIALRRGDSAAAVRAFRAAAERAPQWGRLHRVWGEAEAARGRIDAARALWIKAAGMDLSPADRAKLNGLLAKT